MERRKARCSTFSGPAGLEAVQIHGLGLSSPFSVGWWAICPDDHEAFNLHGQSMVIPRGALIRYREWYGAKAPNEGLKMTAEDVARGILERETVEAPDGTAVREQMAYGVLDPSALPAGRWPVDC
jgi:hypothetical protein